MTDKPRVVVIGLDSATLDLIRPWAEAGLLPNLACLLNEGASGPLCSTVPALSPPAWVSFMTGKNPGQHGIFDFVRRRPNSYRLQYVRLDLPRLNTLFRRLSEQGRRVAVMGVPFTYPAEPVNGVMISGPWAPDVPECIYPPERYSWLKQRQYEINNSQAYTPATAADFAAYITRATAIRIQTMLDLFDEEPWDLFMVVFRDVDTMMTFYWHDMDATHPLHDPARAAQFGKVILEHHQQIDAAIGQLLKRLDERCSVIIMSDHGGGALLGEISINQWLIQQGWLHLKHQNNLFDYYFSLMRRLGLTRKGLIEKMGWPLVHRLKKLLPSWVETAVPWQHTGLADQVDWSRTQAYSIGGVGQIFVNLHGREPQGIVMPGDDYETTLQHIIDGLRQICHPKTQQPIPVQIFRREELYTGPYAMLGADLVVMFDDMRYVTHITLDELRGQLIAPSDDHETGTHRQHGLFIGWGPRIGHTQQVQANLLDLLPTIFYLMDEPIPADVEGRVIAEALNHSSAIGQATRGTVVASAVFTTMPEWSAEEEQKLEQHLRDLGYLG